MLPERELEQKSSVENVCPFPSASPRLNIAAGKRRAGNAASLNDSVVKELSKEFFGGMRMDSTSATRYRSSQHATAVSTIAPAGEGAPGHQVGLDVTGAYKLSHLRALEAQSIHIMREVAAEFERPALMFSGGKDSICLLRLAEKAFRPSDIPMPFLNIETGHEFPELLEFRDRRAKELRNKLITR